MKDISLKKVYIKNEIKIIKKDIFELILLEYTYIIKAVCLHYKNFKPRFSIKRLF